MIIEIGDKGEISLEYNIDKINSIPVEFLNIERSYSYQGIIKEVNNKLLYKISYYLVFTDNSVNKQILHNIYQFGCATTKDGADFYDDLIILHQVLDDIYEEFWKSLQHRIVDLRQMKLSRPHVQPQFAQKMMNHLKENCFYTNQNK